MISSSDQRRTNKKVTGRLIFESSILEARSIGESNQSIEKEETEMLTDADAKA